MAIKRVSFKGVQINFSYLLVNKEKEKSILFLHGWGANKELMKNSFGAFFKDYCHIYLDFPGFGGSSISEAMDSYDIKEAAEEFLRSINKAPQIIIGHSLGGKIALLLNPKILILLSSAGIVLPKRFSVRFKIKLFKMFKFLGLGRLYTLFASKDVKGMNITMYETFKKVVNEDMSGHFKDYKGRAVIFWGKEDNTTPPAAALKIKTFIKDSTLHVLEGSHFFFLDKGKLIEELMTDILKDNK
ncbi:MAG: alpha/beta hydrolase [Campylobacteraceae bacterium]|jgi:pimeloyl-ACP methyl ester carboxylesterase|nr:alpha/beta hydrolase [Campylobacteraceae bacterium]